MSRPALTALLAAVIVLLSGGVADAKGITIWTSYGSIVGDSTPITDAELDWLHNERGVGGLVLQTRQLYGLGGSNQWTGNAAEVGTGVEDTAQRQLRDQNLCARAKARGIKVYLGHYAANYNNNVTPFGTWHDSTLWTTKVIPGVKGLAGAARLYGCAGLAFDGEEYPGASGTTLTWNAVYPGSPNTEAATRALVKQRGREYMQAVSDAFPGAELKVYYFRFPDGFEEEARCTTSTCIDMRTRVFTEFWDGAAEATGWGRIDFFDAWFYKFIGCNANCASWFPGYNGTWPNAIAEAVRRQNTFGLGPLLSSTERAKVGYANFTWVDGQMSSTRQSDLPQPVAAVRAQLLAARDQGTAPDIPVYAYNSIQPIDQAFNYTTGAPGGQSYVPAMQEAADSTPPPPPVCNDGVDNDGDGNTDFPADLGCSSTSDDTEAPDPAYHPACEPTCDAQIAGLTGERNTARQERDAAEAEAARLRRALEDARAIIDAALAP